MRNFGLVVAAMLVTFAGYYAYTTLVVNPKVAEELRLEPQGDRAARVMLLTISDEKVIPVNYLQEGDTVYVGADGPWWREFRSPGAPVELFVKGEQLKGHASVVLDDQAFVDDVFARLRPAAPAWLPDWLNGKLVVIEIVRQQS